MFIIKCNRRIIIALTSKATVTPAFTTPYDDLRWVNFGDRGPSGMNRVSQPSHDVAAIRGHRRCLGSVVMFKNLAEIPSIVGYLRIILLGRTRSNDVVQRHLTI